MPIAGERWRLVGSLQLPVSLTMLGLAAVALVVAGVGTSIGRIVLFDFSLDVSGAILLASAVLLVAGAALTPIGSEWTALLGVLVVSASAPSLRWAALGALVAVATVLAKEGEHLAWIAFGVLGLTPVLQGVATLTSTSTVRVQAVALALGLVLIVLASRVGVIRVLVLPAAGFLVMLAVTTVTSPNLVRLQWITALGAVLLVARMVLAWLIDRSGRSALVRDQLLFALLLLGISARDSLGLGALAAALLLIDLAIVRIEVMPERWSGTAARLVLLARSNWPPAVTSACWPLSCSRGCSWRRCSTATRWRHRRNGRARNLDGSFPLCRSPAGSRPPCYCACSVSDRGRFRATHRAGVDIPEADRHSHAVGRCVPGRGAWNR